MNHPDDCQSGSRLPWNEPEGVECDCGSAMTLEHNELTCDGGCEMKFVTLNVNEPEKIAAIIGRKGSELGYGYSYHIVDFCPIESSIDNVINELQSHSMTHWKFIEDENNE